MRLTSCLFALSACLLTSAAHASWLGWYGQYGNDTGGIIAWSPAVQYAYKDIAAAHCAQYNKVAHITSVHPWYGDYIGFVCEFPRGYDPAKAWYGVPYESTIP